MSKFIDHLMDDVSQELESFLPPCSGENCKECPCCRTGALAWPWVLEPSIVAGIIATTSWEQTCPAACLRCLHCRVHSVTAAAATRSLYSVVYIYNRKFALPGCVPAESRNASAKGFTFHVTLLLETGSLTSLEVGCVS